MALEFNKNNYFCLICCNNIQKANAAIKVNCEEDLISSKKGAPVLEFMFKILCNSLQIKFPAKWSEWNFKKEPFPFCEHCRTEVVNICKLHDQVQLIQDQIRTIAVKLSGRTIESEEKQNNFHKAEGSSKYLPENSSNGNKGFRSKYEYFRQIIINRYNAKLILTNFRNNNKKKLPEKNIISGNSEDVEDTLLSPNERDTKISMVNFESEGVLGTRSKNEIEVNEEGFGINDDSSNSSNTGDVFETNEDDRLGVTSGDEGGALGVGDTFGSNNNLEDSSVMETSNSSFPITVEVETAMESTSKCLDHPTTLEVCRSQSSIESHPDDEGSNDWDVPSTSACSNKNRKNSSSPSKTNTTNRKEKCSPVIKQRRQVLAMAPPTVSVQEIFKTFMEQLKETKKPIEDDQVESDEASDYQDETCSLPTSSEMKDSGTTGTASVQECFQNYLYNLKKNRPKSNKIKLIEDNVYEYRGYKLRIEEHKIVCLACGRICPSDGPIYKCIKKHIRLAHIEKSEESIKSGRIFLLDSDSQKYVLDGFEFTAVTDGYVCSTCNKFCKFGKNGQDKNLIRMHIQGRHMHINRGICPVCGKMTNDVTAHLISVHSQGSQEKTCDTCGKVFKNTPRFNQHLKTHQDVSQYEHQCHQCGKKFRTKAALEFHLKTHAGEKPFVCDFCGHRFNFEVNLKTHIASIHDKTRPFACNQCDWTFGVKYLLTRHIKQVHQGIKPPPPKKRKKVVVVGSSDQEKVPREEILD